MAIYYLDVDDEITSAAARIRDSSDNRIALVLSGGSRVATSRINFRLLAGEAKRRNKRLAIVAADPSVQSVARSAELPVYATVGDYEKAEAARAGGAGVPGAAVGTGVAATGAVAGVMDEPTTTVAPRAPAGRSAVASGAGGGRFLNRRFGPARIPFSVLAGIAAVFVLVLGIGAFFFYPSATVVLTVREEPVGPLSLNVTVDPNLSAPNDLSGTVPGVTKAFPVSTSGTFDATGQSVVDTPASGTVTFDSTNTLFAVPVIAGTQVSAGGIAFTTTRTVSVPAAVVSGNIITHGTADAPITAVQAGLAGNVAAGKIVRLPSDLVAAKVSVSNKSATTGGTHTVTLMIVQADLDQAESSLLAQLNSSFEASVTAADAVPAGSSLFPPTAHLGVTTFSPDPAGLLNQQNPTFDLSAAATGTAVVADVSTVSQLAERRIRGDVKSGYRLVDGSIATQVGTAAAQAGSVVVPVTASAMQTRVLDAATLRSAITGMSLADARTYLEQFGQVSVSLSPDWASTMPSFDFRIDLQIVAAGGQPTPSPSQSGSQHTPRPAVTPAPAAGSPTTGSTPSVAASPSASAAPSATPSAPAPPSPSPSATPAPPTASPSPS
jgi:hypothetical protein